METAFKESRKRKCSAHVRLQPKSSSNYRNYSTKDSSSTTSNRIEFATTSIKRRSQSSSSADTIVIPRKKQRKKSTSSAKPFNYLYKSATHRRRLSSSTSADETGAMPLRGDSDSDQQRQGKASSRIAGRDKSSAAASWSSRKTSTAAAAVSTSSSLTSRRTKQKAAASASTVNNSSSRSSRGVDYVTDNDLDSGGSSSSNLKPTVDGSVVRKRDSVNKRSDNANKTRIETASNATAAQRGSDEPPPPLSSSAAATTTTMTTEGSPSSTSNMSTSVSRQLHSLLDYFPGFESSRRLTRTLTRRLRSSIGGNSCEQSTSDNTADSSSNSDQLITGCGNGKTCSAIQPVVTIVKTGGHTNDPPAALGRMKTRNNKDKNIIFSSSNNNMEKTVPDACSSSPKESPSVRSSQGSSLAHHRSSVNDSFDRSRDFASSSNDSLDGSGKLHQLFESQRSSIPMHIFGALGPRMQTFLGRCQPHFMAASSSQSGSRWDSLLTAMQKHDDTSAQLQGLIELCNLLVMSDEEILGTNFPVKEMVRCLIKLLQIEHNFDIMTHACRALTYLMDLWPRGVAAHVTDAVPYLLEKLQKVECIDVAEQALAALELLSRHHGKYILNANGVGACLQFIDFLSTASQRSALQIVSNCCLHMSSDDFCHLSDSLPSLSQRLASQDKKTVEILCQTFTRLVDNFANEACKLKQLCQHGLLENILQLMIMSPPVLSSSTLCSVIRMLYLMCRQCSDVGVRLLQLNIVAALRLLLVGSADLQSANTELLARSPQEMQELVTLIGELWPALPNDGLFEVDDWLMSSSSSVEHILWTWKDEKGLWRPYMHIDNKILETAYQSKEEELTLSTMGQTFTVDLVNMIQINEETGHSQPILRRVAATSSSSSKKAIGKQSNSILFSRTPDARLELLKCEPGLYEEFVRSTFSVLYEIYTSVGGPVVRTECLRTQLRMIYHSEADVLKDILKKHSVSSLLAGILNSQDLKTVVPALQMARVLIEKQQEIFVVHFRREGVTHQLQKLSSGAVQFHMPTQSSATAVHVTLPSSSTAAPYIIMPSVAGGASSVAGYRYVAQPSMDQTYQSTSTAVYSNHDLTYYAVAAAAAAAAVQTSTNLPSVGSLGLSSALLPPMPSTSVAPVFTPSFAGGALPKRLSAAQDSSRTTLTYSKKRNASNSLPVVSSGGKHAFQPTDKLKVARSRGRGASAELPNGPKISQASYSVPAAHSPSTQAHLLHTQMNQPPAGAGSFLSTGFLSNLALPRWVKSAAYTRQQSNNLPVKTNAATIATSQPSHSSSGLSSSSPLAQSVSSASFNTIKTVSWVKEQAKSIIVTYFACNVGLRPENNEEALLNKLSSVSSALKNGETDGIGDLISVLSSDVSCFEILQSDLIGSLTDYLVHETMPSNISRANRLRHACESFFNVQVTLNEDGLPTVNLPSDQSLMKLFVQKLNTCASQLDQFPVKIHDFAFGSSSGALRGLNALRFLYTQQIKCLLQRHPNEKLLRHWRRGPIKVDPLAQISTIERYLVNRGYGRAKSNSNEELCTDDDNESSGEESDEATVRHVQSMDSTDGLHRLELSMNNKVLPSDLSIYQAVRQFSSRSTSSDPLGGSSVDWLGPEIWVNTHTIFYRLITDAKSPEHSAGEGKFKHNGAKNRAKDKAHLKPVLEPKDIEFKPPIDPLRPYLQHTLSIDCSDPSLQCLNLLRILYGLSRYWWSTFKGALVSDHYPALSINDFVNAKIAGKISRQLQDPLMLIAGQIPSWIEQLALACPFICSFETRMALFNVLALDRDRALQRLLDNFFDTGHVSSSERLTPRLERRKVIISRDDILRQAETVLVNMENSRAVLEVQYENEVGTGLGPTLELYALVSKSLQRSNLQLWRGDVKRSGAETENTDGFVTNQRGLYPTPLGRHIKQAQLDKIKNKFKLIGRLLGRALYDGRILDLPLSPIFYKWLLREENTLNVADLSDLDPVLSKSVQYLLGQLYKSACGSESRIEAKNAIECLELDFTLPGNASVELIKGGKDTPVTVENIEQYTDLVINWILRSGVSRQMEIMRDAFDSVLPLKHLRLFMPEEMDQVFCGARSDLEPWDPAMLRQCIHPDHGYNHDSAQITWLVQILSEYDEHHRRLFLQFITGSPRLPVGGLKNLNPPFTAVRKQDCGTVDSHLPSVMTCVNYLKLPEYSNKEIMAQRLLTAITCGCFSFHLS